MGLFKFRKNREKTKEEGPNPYIDENTPEYIEAEIEVALPGGHRNIEVPMDFKIKGPRYKNPLDPAPIQFSKPVQKVSNEINKNEINEDIHLNHVLASNNPFKSVLSEEPNHQSISPSLNVAAAAIPIAVYSKCDELRKGMLNVYPTILSEYNVSIQDWTRFLEDIVIIGQRIPKRRQFMAGLNLSGDAPNYQLYKYWMKTYGRMQYPLVKDLVKQWNELFFNLRGVVVAFQTPEEIWEMRGNQEEEYEKPKRSHWDALKKNQTKSISIDKTRVLIFAPAPGLSQ